MAIKWTASRDPRLGVRVLRRDGLPVARFYADADDEDIDEIVEQLNERKSDD